MEERREERRRGEEEERERGEVMKIMCLKNTKKQRSIENAFHIAQNDLNATFSTQ